MLDRARDTHLVSPPPFEGLDHADQGIPEEDLLDRRKASQLVSGACEEPRSRTEHRRVRWGRCSVVGDAEVMFGGFVSVLRVLLR